MLPQCLQFAFALTFCFQVTSQNFRADGRAFLVEDLSAAVADDTNTTYLDLLRKAFPGVDRASPAPQRFWLQNLERPDEINARDGKVEILSVQGLWFVHAGEHHLALLVTARHGSGEWSNEFKALAVFAPQAQPRLIDAVEIDFDRFVGFWEESPLLPVRQGETAFWLRAAHHNSSEGFHSYHLAELRDGSLRPALARPFGFIDVRLCGSETSETLKVVGERGAFAGRRVFDLRVRKETRPTGDCEGARPVKRRVAVRTYRLRWDARRKVYRTTRV